MVRGRSQLAFLVTLALLVALVVGCSRQPAGGQTVPFRRISVPERENGYNHFGSMVIGSQEDLDAFLESTSGVGWNLRNEFEDALRGANVDFEREALVLLRHTEGSGSILVTVRPPSLEGRRFIVELDVSTPSSGTTDMAYYCYAFAVSKSRVSEVELRYLSER